MFKVKVWESYSSLPQPSTRRRRLKEKKAMFPMAL